MKTIKIHDWECVVPKYEILTCEKEDSLGEIMTLKELLDLYWNRVVFDYDGTSYEAYKTTSGYYYICDIYGPHKELHGLPLKEMLSRKVKVSDCYEDDYDGCPWTECELL